MNEQNWIPLTDYSSKYRVSISTLRRRIKSESIQFRREAGKYFLLDMPIHGHQVSHRPSQLRVQDRTPQHVEVRDERRSEESQPKVDEPVFTTAQTLLAEIKQAYSQILMEKEEQIMILRDQLSDLQTLVKVLESENDRLNGMLEPANQFDI